MTIRTRYFVLPILTLAVAFPALAATPLTRAEKKAIIGTLNTTQNIRTDSSHTAYYWIRFRAHVKDIVSGAKQTVKLPAKLGLPASAKCYSFVCQTNTPHIMRAGKPDQKKVAEAKREITGHIIQFPGGKPLVLGYTFSAQRVDELDGSKR